MARGQVSVLLPDGRRVSFEQGEVATIGRDERAAIPIPDERVSRHHATLHWASGSWVIDDSNSTNGIFLGTKRVRRVRVGKNTVIRLAANDGPILELTAASRGVSARAVALAVVFALAGAAAALVVALGGLPSTLSREAPASPTPPVSASVTPRALGIPAVAAIGRLGVVYIETRTASGSGAYLGNDRVLTAAHVIADQSGGIDVYFSGRLVGAAVLLSRDTAVDLALLRVAGLERAGARALSWGDSRSLATGDQIVVLGYPSVVGLTVTAGIVSGAKRLGSSDLVQTDAAVNHGNSGGPMLNDRGELVAIADFIISNTVGLNFGIATSTARLFFDRATR